MIPRKMLLNHFVMHATYNIVIPILNSCPASVSGLTQDDSSEDGRSFCEYLYHFVMHYSHSNLKIMSFLYVQPHSAAPQQSGHQVSLGWDGFIILEHRNIWDQCWSRIFVHIVLTRASSFLKVPRSWWTAGDRGLWSDEHQGAAW